MVKIVDDYNKAEIQFATDQVHIQESDSSTIVSGLCNRKFNHAQLRWALWADDESSRPLMIGDSECRSGQFAFDISNLENLVCGVQHRLVIEGDWGGTAITQFDKICAQAQAAQ